VKLKIYLSILLVFAVVVGCGKAENEVEHIKELVSDYSLGKIKNESASITSEHLIVKKSNGDEEIYDLPEDEFFVSIAPYVNETHP
jgi:hypothetical protein